MLAVFSVTSDLDDGAVGTLRDAINQANASPGIDTIVFNGVTEINLTQAGGIHITDDLIINGSLMVPNNLTINAAAGSNIFVVDDQDDSALSTVAINDVSFRLGDVSTDMLASQGGAIVNHEDLAVRDSLFSENSALEGGAIANFGVLTANNTDFSENTASGAGGGAIWNAPGSTTVLSGGTISGNTATDEGGGVLSEADATLTINGGTSLHGNMAVSGGALAFKDAASGQLMAATISSNTATTGGGLFATGLGTEVFAFQATTVQLNLSRTGAGIASASQALISLRGSLISGNVAGGNGGGLAAMSGSTIDLIGADIASNSAGASVPIARGGGVFASGSIVDIDGGNISYNGLSATVASIDYGGGIFAGNGAALTVTGTRFNQNRALRGGAFFASGNAIDGIVTSVTLSNAIVENSTAELSGGGGFVDESVALTIENSTITGNSATNGAGGGLHLAAVGMDGDQTVTTSLTNVDLTLNFAESRGGGLYSVGGVDLDISSSTVSSNSATVAGGGLHLSGAGGANSMSITRSLVAGNVVEDTMGPQSLVQAGGGVWAGEGANVDIASSTIRDNSAALDGGGISADATSSFTLQSSTVSGNDSLDGAGASFSNASATILQSTFYGNDAKRNGGGMFVMPGNATLISLNHSTMSLNSAAGSSVGEGGAIYLGAGDIGDAPSLSLNHTIVSTNLSGPLAGFDEIYDAAAALGSSQIEVAYSLIRDNVDTLLDPASPMNADSMIGTSAVPIDAMLLPLANNGGPTRTMLPQLTSPVINAGDPAFLGPPNFDQRLSPYTRVHVVIDIGATELITPDFDGDGFATCVDVDALTAQIASGANDPQFDLTGDGQVNLLDLDRWLDDAPIVNGLNIDRYLIGDANLDTVVDGSDFIIWNNHKFTATAAFCSADFNADGVVDGQDFVLWNGNKFTQSSLTAVDHDTSDAGESRTSNVPAFEAAIAIKSADAPGFSISAAGLKTREQSVAARPKTSNGRRDTAGSQLDSDSINPISVDSAIAEWGFSGRLASDGRAAR